jgi:hypothetical protein
VGQTAFALGGSIRGRARGCSMIRLIFYAALMAAGSQNHVLKQNRTK